RHEHFARAGGSGNARSDVDGDSSHLAVLELALAGVEAGPQVEIELTHRFDNRAGAGDPPRRPVEDREEAVTGRIELLAAKPGQLAPHEDVVIVHELAPSSV